MFNALKSLVVITLCLTVGTIFATNQTPAPTDMRKLTTGEQTLTVGYIHFPPFADINSEPIGMDLEIIKEVAKKAKIKKIVLVKSKDMPELIANLNKGKINLIASGLFITPERKQKYLLTEPYYLAGGVGFLYVNNQHSFKTANDLQGYRIGALNYGYVQRFWLPQHGISNQKIMPFLTLEDAFRALKNGEIDVIVTNYSVCRYYATKDKQMAVSLAQPLGTAYLMRKQDSALQQTLNQALLSMWKDGSLYAIKLKYLKPIGIQPHKELSP